MNIHVTLAGVCETVVGVIVSWCLIKILYFFWVLSRWDKH